MNAIDCPAEDTLQAFHLGLLAETELEHVATHAEGCARCEERLAALDRKSDALLDAVRVTPGVKPTLPGYEILGLLGEGGMGFVCRARDLRLNRDVAVKFLRGAVSPEAIDRFRREAETIARLQHPNIVQIFEVGEHQAAPYIVLELIEGGSLERKLAGQPQPPGDSTELVEVLARATEHAHARGVIHRDLKPANVLLQTDGTPRLTDFGIAKLVDSPAGSTRTGAVLGTPAYMAPEQAEGRAIGPTADVYSLGAILYQMLTGRPPFGTDSGAALILRVMNEAPASPSRLRAHLPRDLETICLKCLEKDPARRYSSAAELADDLGRFRDGRPIRARPARAWEVAWKWARRHPSASAAIVVAQAALLLVAGGTVWYNSRLQNALAASQAAEGRAERSAATARAAEARAEADAEEALRIHLLLVDEVQFQIPNKPETRQLRRKLLETAVDGLRRVTDRDGPTSGRAAARRAVAHSLHGDLLRQLGLTGEAVTAFEKCRQAAIEMAADAPDSLEARRLHILACTSLTELYLYRENAPRALELAQECLKLAEAYRAAEANSTEARMAMADAFEGIARAALEKQDVTVAVGAIDRMAELAKTWPRAEQSGALEASEVDQRMLSLRGTQYQLQGIPLAALAHKRKSLGLMTIQADIEKTFRHIGRRISSQRSIRRKVMEENLELSRLCLQLNDVPAARRHAADALGTARKQIAEDATNVQYQLELVEALHWSGDVERDDARSTAAIAFFKECQTLLAKSHEAGHLIDLPRFSLQAKQVSHDLVFCDLIPRVVNEPALGWKQSIATAYGLARARIRILAREKQEAGLEQAVGDVCARRPADAEEWYELARTCSSAVRVLETTSPAVKQKLVERLFTSGMEALTRAVDARHPALQGNWYFDPRVNGLSSRPEYRALYDRTNPMIAKPR